MQGATDEQDRQDMTRLAAGHDAALSSLMDRHSERLFCYLLRQLNNQTDAADLAQETFFAFIRIAPASVLSSDSQPGSMPLPLTCYETDSAGTSVTRKSRSTPRPSSAPLCKIPCVTLWLLPANSWRQANAQKKSGAPCKSWQWNCAPH